MSRPSRVKGKLIKNCPWSLPKISVIARLNTLCSTTERSEGDVWTGRISLKK